MRNQEQGAPADAQLERAVSELQGMIAERYPTATFDVSHGEDPEGLYLIPTVDVSDTEEVFDVVVERLLEMQIDDELAIYVVPVRPVDRVIEEMRSQTRAGRQHGQALDRMPTHLAR